MRPLRETDALLIIDVQRDFMPGGALAVADGDAVIAPINRLLAHFPLSYGEQTLWPDHCIIGSKGAEFGPGLALDKVELVLRKGFRSTVDSYSGFFENDRTTPTGLHGYLAERGLQRLFLAGLARDHCVHYTAVDALALGYEVIVIENACRAIDAAAVVTSGQSTTVDALLA